MTDPAGHAWGISGPVFLMIFVGLGAALVAVAVLHSSAQRCRTATPGASPAPSFS